MIYIDKILNDLNINLYGAIAYSAVKNHLIDNNAKKRLVTDTKTIIVVALPYKVTTNLCSNLSLYASIADYHNTLGNKLRLACGRLKALHPNEDFQYFVDDSPFPEVDCAVMAGLGVRGDNNLLITKEYGSYVFLGCIATGLELLYKSYPKNTCTHCGQCVKACPCSDLPEFTDKKCLSAITQKKGELTESDIKFIAQNNTVWGCDICQTVCPLNQDANDTSEPEFKTSFAPYYTPEKFDNTYPYAWRGRDTINRNYYIKKGCNN